MQRPILITAFDVIAAKLAVQLGRIPPDAVRDHLRARDVDPTQRLDLVFRLEVMGLLQPAQTQSIRRYVALFEYTFFEAVYLRQLERRGLSKDDVYDLLARAESGPGRRQLGALLVAMGRMTPAQREEIGRITHQNVLRHDRQVVQRYRQRDFEGIDRPLLPQGIVSDRSFTVSAIFRSGETRSRIKEIVRTLETHPDVQLPLPSLDPDAPPDESRDHDQDSPLHSGIFSLDAHAATTQVEEALDDEDQADALRGQVGVVESPSGSRSTYVGLHPAGDADQLRSIGPYEVLECLGKGAMGTVFLAQSGPGQMVAVKVLHPDAEYEDVQRFEREALISSKFDHPNLVRVIDSGQTEDGLRYMVLPPYPSESLQEFMQAGRLDPPAALAVLEQLLEALSAVHALGVVHRDVKPSNVLVLELGDQELSVKLVDFGISRALNPLDLAAGGFRSAMGSLSGSPAYIAPETVIGGDCDARTDIYSLGVMTYEMFSRRLPFQSKKAIAIMREHVLSVPPTLAEGRPELSWHPDLEKLLASMLAKEQPNRPASCQEILELLRGGMKQRVLERLKEPPKPQDPNKSHEQLFNRFFPA